MDDRLKALDRVTSTAIDLAMKFGPRIAFPVPQHEVRMLPV